MIYNSLIYLLEFGLIVSTTFIFEKVKQCVRCEHCIQITNPLCPSKMKDTASGYPLNICGHEMDKLNTGDEIDQGMNHSRSENEFGDSNCRMSSGYITTENNSKHQKLCDSKDSGMSQISIEGENDRLNNSPSSQTQNNESNFTVLTNKSFFNALCCLTGSLLFTVVLVISICTVYVVDTNSVGKYKCYWTSVCVMEENKISACSNKFAYLQNFMQVIETRRSMNGTTDVAQSNIFFPKTKSKGRRHIKDPQNALMESKPSKRLVTNANVLDIKENKVIIKEDGRYLISFNLLLKRELRRNHTTTSEIAVSVVREVIGNHKPFPIMSEIIPVLHGEQTLQPVSLTDRFRLEKGDRISIRVDNSRLIYRCRNCNKITIMKVSNS